jgi:hypothetical protein
MHPDLIAQRKFADDSALERTLVENKKSYTIEVISNITVFHYICPFW